MSTVKELKRPFDVRVIQIGAVANIVVFIQSGCPHLMKLLYEEDCFASVL